MTTSLAIHDLVWTRLQTAVDITVYDGEPPATPPYDEDARVLAYACLYAWAGMPLSTDLTGDQKGLMGSFQITCVGGDFPRTLACVDSVRAAVLGVVTLGSTTRVIREREDTAQTPIRSDLGVWPPRHYVPLDFQLFAP